MRQIIALFVFALFAFGACAQDTSKKMPSPEEMKQMMESSMGAMGPMMAKMSEATIEAQLAAAEKPETARRIAVFKKNLYDALLQQGFSKERAFSIVLSTPLPSASGGLRQ
jgi:hypothetical protein